MIIAIGGKMGSGKNTVCDIIQELCEKHNGPKFEQKAFAGKLKQTASLLTGVPIEMWEDQEFKKQEMPKCWNKLQQSGRNKVSIPMTYREFLQKLGTEAMRDGLHTNVWVNALFADYTYNKICNCKKNCRCEHDLPNWIITDLRFPNEMDAVKERNGITIRVVRSFNHKMGSKETGTIDLTPLHPSETALDGAKFDYEIINDGTIEDLIEKVKQILIKKGII